MALKHVKEYFIEVQNQYFEMLKDVSDFDKALKAGEVEQEQFDQAQEILNRVKDNYERLAFILHLFEKPRRDKKHAKYNKQNPLLATHFKDDKVRVITENNDALKEFKELLRGIKTDKGD